MKNLILSTTLFFDTLVTYLLYCRQFSILLNCIFWNIWHCTHKCLYKCLYIVHINVNPHKCLYIYVLIQELLVNKNHFFEFLLISDKVRLVHLNIITANGRTNLGKTSHACPSQKRKWKQLELRTCFIAKFQQLKISNFALEFLTL